MAIGDNIKQIRKEKKLTQQELAKKMGISRSYLSDVENNRYNPSSKTIETLAEKLDVSMFYLTTGKKALGDLTDDEKQEAVKGVGESLKKHKKEMQFDFKKDIESILSSELSFAETTYLANMVQFLKISNTQDIIGITSIIRTLINSVEYKNTEEVRKEEINEFLKGELDDITKFFHDYFFSENKEGD